MASTATLEFPGDRWARIDDGQWAASDSALLATILAIVGQLDELGPQDGDPSIAQASIIAEATGAKMSGVEMPHTPGTVY